MQNTGSTQALDCETFVLQPILADLQQPTIRQAVGRDSMTGLLSQTRQTPAALSATHRESAGLSSSQILILILVQLLMNTQSSKDIKNTHTIVCNI